MGENIFINYRRSEDRSAAGRLYDQLETVFGREHVFLDVDGILPGKDFVDVLTVRIAECDILLAIIGKRWIEVADAHGARRLDDPGDYVRLEIESALKLGKHVIPILLDDTVMPTAAQLPASIAALARRNAIRLSHERFKLEVGALVQSIALLRGKAGPTPAQAPDLRPSSSATPPGPRRMRRLGLAGAAVIVTIAATGLFLSRTAPHSSNPPDTAPRVAVQPSPPNPAPVGAAAQAPQAAPQLAAPPAAVAQPATIPASVSPAAASPTPVVASSRPPAVARPAAAAPPRRLTAAARETMSACGRSDIAVSVATGETGKAVLTRSWLLPSEGRIRTLAVGEAVEIAAGCDIRLAGVRPGDWALFDFDEIDKR